MWREAKRHWCNAAGPVTLLTVFLKDWRNIFVEGHEDLFDVAVGVLDSAPNNVTAVSRAAAAIRLRICMGFLAFDQ